MRVELERWNSAWLNRCLLCLASRSGNVDIVVVVVIVRRGLAASSSSWRPEDIKSTSGAGLLTLKPGSETVRVEDVITRQFFGGRGQHFFPKKGERIIVNY